jgi:serine/threonine protein kinase
MGEALSSNASSDEEGFTEEQNQTLYDFVNGVNRSYRDEDDEELSEKVVPVYVPEVKQVATPPRSSTPEIEEQEELRMPTPPRTPTPPQTPTPPAEIVLKSKSNSSKSSKSSGSQQGHGGFEITELDYVSSANEFRIDHGKFTEEIDGTLRLDYKIG